MGLLDYAGLAAANRRQGVGHTLGPDKGYRILP